MKSGPKGREPTRSAEQQVKAGSKATASEGGFPENQLWTRLTTAIPGLRAKLRVGGPDDPEEAEAERVADRIVGSAAGAAAPGHRDDGADAGRSPGGDSPADPEATTEARIRSLRGGGQPLPPSLATFFEPRLGGDLRDIRVHTDHDAVRTADEIGARAYTFGTDIAFGEGEYRPDSPQGRHLLAHELTHVAQQRRASTGSDLRRQAAPAAAESSSTLLVADGAAPGPGQMRMGDFLAEVRAEVCRALEPVLSARGRTTEGCPYLDRLFPYLERQSPGAAERILRRFAPDVADPESPRVYIPRIVERARASTAHWLDTGEITGLPQGLPTSLESLAELAQGAGGALSNVSLLFKARPGGPVRRASPADVQAQLGAGQPLEGRIRTPMETAFGTGFSDVRIHTDAPASRLSSEMKARAFTVGSDVAFGPGEYRPGTLVGDALLAHELAHVVQQRGAGPSMEADPESAADAAAQAVMEGREPVPGAVGGIRLQRCSIEGHGYDPTAGDSATEDYHADPPTPQEMIDRHTTATGDLDEEALGETLALMAWYTPRHHDFVRRVFEALDSGNRDDVAAAMIANTQETDLIDIARTEEGRALLNFIVPELTGGWTWPGGDVYAAVRAMRALRAYESAQEAVDDEIADMRRAVGATRAPEEEPVEQLSRDQIRERLRLVEAHLDTFERRWGDQPDVQAAVDGVRARVADARANLDTDAASISRSVQIAQQILETCELMLEETGRQIAALQGALRRRGTEEANVALLRFVRERFVEALGAAMSPEATLRFAQASAALQQMQLSQAEIELAVLQNRPGLFSSVTPKLEAMRGFADWIVDRLHELETEAREIREAQQAGEDVSERREAAQRKFETIALSHRVLANWEVVIQVAEALESGFSFTEWFYWHDVDVDSLHTTLLRLSELAKNGSLDALRRDVGAFETDEEIQAFYEDVPSILRSSGLVVSIGVVIAAALATWGVGAIFAAPAGAGAGAAAAGTTTTVTAGSVAAGLGTAALEALVFTSVHRGLATVTGTGTQGSFFEDLLWNFGLFSVLRGTGALLRTSLAARELSHLARPAQLGASFGILEVYGVSRFIVEEGRWPTAAEFGSMTAQTVVILASLVAVHGAVHRLSPIGRFNARWGREFEAIRLEQRALERDARRALEQNRTSEFEAELRQRGEALEGRLNDLVSRVIAEGNVGALRTQLEGMRGMQAAQSALTESLGLLPEVALQRAGTPNTYSYRHGETSRLTRGLQGLRPSEVQVQEPAAGRARVVEVQFGDRPSMYFVERAPEARPQGPATTTAPAEQVPRPEANARRLEAAKEEMTRRRIPWSRVPEGLQDLETARPRGQSVPEVVEQTAAKLGRLEAWLGRQSETAWQMGHEAKIEVPVDAARAEVASLPEGPLRDHLQGNERAAIVYGALRQTSPRTAAARMRGMWDAWTASGQEGSFAEFAESTLVEAAVVRLRTAGDTALADMLQADARVQNAFGRMGYDTARLRAVYLYQQHGYGGRLTFPEYVQQQVGSLQGEGRSWGERRGNLVIPIPESGFEPLRTRLSARTADGSLSPTDAGIIWRWNGIIEALITGSGARVPGQETGTSRASAVLNYLLEGVGKNFSESSYRTFRHRMRDLMVDDILYLPEGADTANSPGNAGGRAIRPWAEQNARLEAWEGRVPTGDSATIGALWTAYARARFVLGEPAGTTAAGIQPIAGRSLRMPDGRMADDAARFGRRTDPSAPEPGEWAVDYKGGADPHRTEQSQNYSDNMSANGGRFSMGGHVYRGLAYIYRSATAAESTAATLNAAGLHPNLKVGYYGPTGAIIWVR